MLHLAHLQARTLGSNATLRREAILGVSVLERSDASFIRSQGIGTHLLAGQAESVLRATSEPKRTLEPFLPPNSRSPRSFAPWVPLPSRGSFGPGSRRRRGGSVATSGAQFRSRFQATTSTPRLSVAGIDVATVERRGVSRVLKFEDACLPSEPRGGAQLLGFAAEWRSVEISSLLNEGAVEELDMATLSPAFYRWILLVPKKDGTFRLVFDLEVPEVLNVYARKEEFKMTTPGAATRALHTGIGWQVSIWKTLTSTSPYTGSHADYCDLQ